MKKLLSIIAITAITFSATAQEKRQTTQSKDASHHGKHKQHHHNNKELMKGITFSDAQKSQMKANREAFRSKMDALKKQDNITVADMRSKKKDLYKEQKAQMDNLFTPEQKAQLAQNKSAIELKRKEMHEKRAKEMQAKLNLSNDQVEKLKARSEADHVKMKAIRENESLSREDKKAQMKTLKDAAKEDRKSILTADQLKKLEELKKDRASKFSTQSKK